MIPLGERHPKSTYVMGVDFARMGSDLSVYIVLEQTMDSDNLYAVYIEEQQHKKLTDAMGRVKILEKYFNFVKIIMDETGLGAGAVDELNETVGWKAEGLRFTIQSKNDIYSNLKKLMAQGRLKIPRHQKLLYQLSDLRYEATSTGMLKIHHGERGHDDYCDALALAAYWWKERTQKPIFTIQ